MFFSNSQAGGGRTIQNGWCPATLDGATTHGDHGSVTKLDRCHTLMAVTALGELIEARRDFLRISYRDMERRVKGRIKHNRFNQLATKPIKTMPATETIHAIAEALELPVTVVTDAALETVGLRRTMGPPSSWVTRIHRAMELPEASQRVLEVQVDALIGMHEETKRDGR